MDETTPAIPYIRWAGVTIAEPGGVTPTRRLYDHELTYVLSGQGEILTERGRYAAGADACFMTLPRVPQSLHNTGATPWVTLGVHFDWERDDFARFPNFGADDGSRPPDETLFREAREIPGWNTPKRAVLNLSGRPLTRHFLEQTQTAFVRWDAFARLQAGALLLAAIAQIQRELSLMADGKKARIVGPDAQRRLNDARWLLEQTGADALSIAEIAARVDWSVDYLGYMARTAWGVSPRALQSEARLRQARQLLGEGVPVAEVARQCGFADTSHLARAFRKDSGLTPREYSALAARK